MPDTAEQRARAAQQRDAGLLSPGDEGYDRKMSEMWGGPPAKFFDAAMREFAAEYSGEGRVALVTGGAGGIGFYVSKLLAALRFTVIVPPRPGLEPDARGAAAAIVKAVPGARVVVPQVPLDLRSFASVRGFAAAMRRELKQIDVLCLNAGRGGGKDDVRETTPDSGEAIMQVNALAHFLLAAELMPLLRASAAARVVSQTSGARFFAKPQKVGDIGGTDAASFNAFDQYSLSKAANVLFTRALNERLVAAGVTNVVACVSDPGLSSTGVNIQHDLVKSMGLDSRMKDTNQFHDRAGHHAADGALPMVLASVHPAAGRNAWFTTDGKQAKSLAEAAHRQDPATGGQAATDPLNSTGAWPRSACESFWEQAVAATGEAFDALKVPNSKL